MYTIALQSVSPLGTQIDFHAKASQIKDVPVAQYNPETEEGEQRELSEKRVQQIHEQTGDGHNDEMVFMEHLIFVAAKKDYKKLVRQKAALSKLGSNVVEVDCDQLVNYCQNSDGQHKAGVLAKKLDENGQDCAVKITIIFVEDELTAKKVFIIGNCFGKSVTPNLTSALVASFAREPMEWAPIEYKYRALAGEATFWLERSSGVLRKRINLPNTKPTKGNSSFSNVVGGILEGGKIWIGYFRECSFQDRINVLEFGLKAFAEITPMFSKEAYTDFKHASMDPLLISVIIGAGYGLKKAGIPWTQENFTNALRPLIKENKIGWADPDDGDKLKAARKGGLLLNLRESTQSGGERGAARNAILHFLNNYHGWGIEL